jgi:hypothetical protein
LAATVHPAPGAEQVVEAQPRQGGEANRERHDEARRVEAMAADAPEKKGAVEVPTRMGYVPTSDSERWIRPNEASNWKGIDT